VALSTDRFPNERDVQRYFARALAHSPSFPESSDGGGRQPARSNVPNEEAFEVDNQKPATAAKCRAVTCRR
jgi:hypothetical protein